MSKWRRLQKNTGLYGYVPETKLCRDCGFDTSPGSPTREQAQEQLNRTGKFTFYGSSEGETYIVHDHVWQAAGMKEWSDVGESGVLCIGCLEKRIGRELRPEDFDHDHPFFKLPGTERMLRRQGRYQHYDFEMVEGWTAPPPTELERALALISPHREARL